ncbi:hypothetical protein AAVH_33785 [Aphelenchoides avenae]|nr:hypothetical protein AAVH_33785 [Aphelenchus avenae]
MRAEREKDVFPVILEIFFYLLLIGLAGAFTYHGITDPEFFKTISQEQRTARLVIEQMREEFGTKAHTHSQDSEAHERHAPTSSGSTADSTIDGHSEGLTQRLDRLESLMVQLTENLGAVQDRIESIVSRQSAEDDPTGRGTASHSHEKTAHAESGTTELSKDPSLPMVLLAVLGIICAPAMLAYRFKADEAEKQRQESEKRRQFAEELVKRLAVKFGVGSRPRGSKKESRSEDEDDASFENLGFSDNETST